MVRELGIRADEEQLFAAALAGAQELNERCLLLLQRIASERPACLPQALVTLAGQFRQLDPESIRRGAEQPFLLFDFAFGKPRILRELLGRESSALRFPNLAATLPVDEASALARASLILAQSVCRHHPAHAGLLFGMDPSLVEWIAQLRQADVERLAQENPHYVRIRWEQQRDIWQQLLAAAASGDPEASTNFRMYGIQLIAGEMCLRMGGAG